MPTQYTGTSIVDYLKAVGQPSDFASRSKIAAEKGIANYAGTAQQNTQLLGLLNVASQDQTKAKPLTQIPGYQTPAESITQVQTKDKPLTEVPGYKAPPGGLSPLAKQTKQTATGGAYAGVSIVDYLSSIGQSSDFQSRSRMARDLGITNYIGSATQNTRMLRLLREDQETEDEKVEVTPEETTVKTGEDEEPQDKQEEIIDIDKTANEDSDAEYEILTEDGDKDVEVSDSAKLVKKLLAKLDEEPEKDKTTTEVYSEQRELLGIDDLENQFAASEAALEKLDADFASTLEEEEGRRVGMRTIRRRQTAQELKYNRQRRDLVADRNSLANQLNMKYNVLNNIVKYTGQDYDDAQQDYQFKFNATMQLTNLLVGIEDKAKTVEERQNDNARANLQIMYGLFKGGNVSYDSLDSATQLDIKNMELQAGKYSISNVNIGQAGATSTTKLISQAKINTLAAAGVPEAIALDIQRSLNAGITEPTIIAHLDKQLGEGKGKAMMEAYKSIMSDTTFQF